MPSLAELDIVLLCAPNAGPMTLSGTNTWVAGRSPAWVIDPGPAIESHVDATVQEVASRGGLGGVALTHRHFDHTEALAALIDRAGPAPVVASQAGGAVETAVADGERCGPLAAVATPGHSPDHLAFVMGGACFTGDAVLGEGSVFVSAYAGSLAGYLASLRRLRAMDLTVLCPGHGPVLWDPRAKLDEYLAHRLERERRLVDALAYGRRTVSELLDAAWSDAPPALRGPAALTLAAHLDKLEEEGRLPAGVQRPRVGRDGGPPEDD